MINKRVITAMAESPKPDEHANWDALNSQLEASFTRFSQEAIKRVDDAIDLKLKNVSGAENSPGLLAHWKAVEIVLSSGFFFVCLGLGLLYSASRSLGTVHGSFTFVLVVLGVAVLLYGTGTQGMGTVSGDRQMAQYKVALAGGAGILAFVAGFGMVHYKGDMQDIFDIENKFLIVELPPSNNASLMIGEVSNSYVVQFFKDGVPLPSKVQNDRFVAYVPYRETDISKGKSLELTYSVFAKDGSALSRDLTRNTSGRVPILLDMNKFDNTQPGWDFLVYKLPTEKAGASSAEVLAFGVNLKSKETLELDLITAGEQSLEPEGPLTPSVDALVLAQ